MISANKVYIVEDVSGIRLMLETCMTENGFDVVGSSATAEKAYEELQSIHTDIVLLDIKLAGEKSGVWLGDKINNELKLPFIYITANQGQVSSNELLDTNPMGFIVKPIDILQLITTIKIALNQQQKHVSKRIIIQTGLKAINIEEDSISYIKSDGNYLHLFLDSSYFLIRSTMDSFIERLTPDKFLRIHQRYLINPDKPFKINGNNIEISDTVLTISSKFKKALKVKLLS